MLQQKCKMQHVRLVVWKQSQNCDPFAAERRCDGTYLYVKIYKQMLKLRQHLFHCFFLSLFIMQCVNRKQKKIGQITEKASNGYQIHIMHCRHVVSKFTELYSYQCSLDGQSWHFEVSIVSMWEVEREPHSNCYCKINQR